MDYECAIIGGGIAGLQAAVQLGRYGHRTIVIDASDGRSTLCRSYHNLLGWPDGVSGEELRRLGRLQAERTGVRFVDGRATEAAAEAAADGSGFRIAYARQDANAGESTVVTAKTVLLATGLLDRFPELPGLRACLGRTVYVCPDCDGYEIKGKRTVVLGSGNVGANMAIELRPWTDRLLYVNHEFAAVDGDKRAKLEQLGIGYADRPVDRIVEQGDGLIAGIRFGDGSELEAERGFIAFGGNDVRSGLARQLGVERMETGHVPMDRRTGMTNVKGVWAAGDVAVHSQQASIAMGDGMQAAIWMHKSLIGGGP